MSEPAAGDTPRDVNPDAPRVETGHLKHESGCGLEPVMSVAGGVAVLVHATWVTDAVWFWQCPGCECAFGPLVDYDTAERGAAEHDRDEHPGAVADAVGALR